MFDLENIKLKLKKSANKKCIKQKIVILIWKKIGIAIWYFLKGSNVTAKCCPYKASYT